MKAHIRLWPRSTYSLADNRTLIQYLQAHHVCLPGDVNSRGRYEHRMPSVNGYHVQSARSPLIALTRSTQPVGERLNGRNIQTLSVAEVCGRPLDEAQRCSAIYSCADLLHLPILKTKRERATILRKQLSEVTALAKEPAQY